MYYLRLLDGLSVEGPAGPVSGRAVQRRQLALLALLGSAGETGLSRDRLIGHLWPESDEARARHLLRDSLYHLRRELGEDAVLTSGEAVRLNPEVVWCDVGAFRGALERGALEEAVGHYRGPFLNGFHARDVAEYERWADGERQRLGSQYEEALESLARAAEEAGDYPQAVGWWRRLCGHDRYNTRFVVSLMEALAAAGDPANAQQAAAEHEAVLREELGEEAAAEFRALAEQFKARGFSDRLDPSAAEASYIDPSLDAQERSSSELTAPASLRPRRRWRSSAVAVAAVALVGVASWVLARASADRRSPLDGSEAAGSTILAILPLVETSGDPDNEWFADGLTAELINTLASVPGLQVTPRASAFTFKGQPFDPQEIARELGAGAVMTGTMMRRGDELSISVELVDLQYKSQLWGMRYTRSLADVFEIEEEIVRSVVAALGVPLSDLAVEKLDRRPTLDPEAYQLYLRGRHLSTWASSIPNWPKAIDYFNRAIALDSTFAAAYAAKGTAYLFMAIVGPPSELYPNARASAEAALKIDDTLAEAHAVLGGVHLFSEWNWRAAERQLTRAIALDPSDPNARHRYSEYLLVMGRFDDFIAEAHLKHEIDPRAPDRDAVLALAYRLVGRHEEAIYYLHKGLEVNPNNGWMHAQLAVVYSQKEMFPEAVAQAERAERLLRPNPDALPLAAVAFAVSGKRSEAERILSELRTLEKTRYYDPTHIAAIYDSLGDIDEAVHWYTKAFDQRTQDFLYSVASPGESWENARSDPRYQALVARVGLP